MTMNDLLNQAKAENEQLRARVEELELRIAEIESQPNVEQIDVGMMLQGLMIKDGGNDEPSIR